MRFHSKEQHQDFLKNIIEELRLVRRIQDLQVLHSFTQYDDVTTLYL